jgi:DNA polymerase I-like protein with 3'-5' exonuclease and polymerase domains
VENGRGRGAAPVATDVLTERLEGHHLGMLLEESGIRAEVVEERGYRTIRAKTELAQRGFGRTQQGVPGLLIPIYGPTGEITLYQYRPDEPRVKDGKVIKYETPSGSNMVLDVHPSVRKKLGDPSVPLFVTEGVKKGDALVSRSLCAATLLGVWNWRGTNGRGGKTALPDWEYVALNERLVYVVFDSDVMIKPEVHEALKRIKGFLENRGAQVAAVYLPAGSGGSKQGVDDFLAAGRTIDELLALATTELREPPSGEFEPDVPYRATQHGLLWEKPTKEGPVLVPLTNFTARVVSDVVKDDSVEVFREFEIEARLGEARATFIVPAAHFGGMGWAVEHLGAGAVVYAGFGLKDHARAAVQLLSGDVPRHHEYAHLGWREIGGAWYYLHAGGAIGAATGAAVTPEGVPRDPRVTPTEALGSRHDAGRDAGFRAGVTSVTHPEIYTQPPNALAGYTLPETPSGAKLAEAVRASIRVSEVASLTATVPGLAAVWRAPLGPTDFGVHYHGRTGLGKSELAALLQQHYGAGMNARNLPASWSSTANANEGLAFAAKDAVMVVDDFAPTGSTTDQARLHRDADRLFRGKGNALGRQRMRPDGTLRPQKPPRALILSTGEDVPRGHSLRSRLLVVNVGAEDVDWQRLTAAQSDGARGLFARAMAAYLGWLAPRYGDIQEPLRREVEEERERLRREGQHPRTPEILANLRVGLRYFLRFAVEVGAVKEAEAAKYRETWHATLAKVDLDQSRYHASEDPVEQFLDLVRASIQGGSAHLANQKTGREPESYPGHWGWQHRRGYDDPDEWLPRGTRIGWVSPEGENVFLSADNAYAAAQELARKQNANIPVSKETLIKYLKERGLLASVEKDTGRATPRRRMAGKVTRVLHLATRTLFPGPPPDDDDDPDGGANPVGPGGEGGDEECAHGERASSHPNLMQGSQGSHQPEEARPSADGPVTAATLEGSRGGHGGVPPWSRPTLVASEDLPALVEEIRSSEVVGLDLETTGLNPRRDRVRLLSLATAGGTWLVDCFAIDSEPILGALKEKALVIHNAAFDLGFLGRLAYKHEGEVVDTMLLSQLLYAGLKEQSANGKQAAVRHSLEDVCRRELGIGLDKSHQTADWSGELTPEMVEYAARDAEVLLRLHEAFTDKVKQKGLEWIADIENKALLAIVWMADAGVSFDAKGWKVYLGGVEEEKERLKGKLDDLAPDRPEGREWNWNSYQQILEAFRLLGHDLPNTKEKTLARCEQPLAKALLDYRKASKVVSTFGPNLLGFVREDGRIYASWRQIGTETGRMSCSQPNLQQLSPEVKRYVRAQEGKALFKADYSQIELRILAKVSSDPALMETFERRQDLHRVTAAKMFGVALEKEVTDEQRKAAKSINFGLIYGRGPRSLAEQLGTDVRTAGQLIDQYFSAYPKVKDYLGKASEAALRSRTVMTMTGRTRSFEDISVMSKAQIRALRREATNFPIQATCADGLKLALALLWERREEFPGAVPILAVHDEIVVECNKEDAEEVAAWLKKAMVDGMNAVVNADEPRVPIEVDVTPLQTWGG